jgi:DNA repair protein RadC
LLPQRMQPAHRILNDIDAVGDAELLATLLWTGTRQAEIDAAYALLQKVNGDLMLLRRYSTEELRCLGLDDRTIGRLRAVIEIENRLAVPTDEHVQAITGPNEAAKLMMIRLRGREQEELLVMSLDGALHILGIDTVALGQPNTASFRIADLFGPPVRHHATAMIMFHNHPAGNPEPSPADIATTTDMILLGKSMQIELLDHVIIGQGRFTSIRERGLVKFR